MSQFVPECRLYSRSMSTKKSRIYLKCNRSLHDPEEARFVLLVDNPRVGVVGQQRDEKFKRFPNHIHTSFLSANTRS